MLKTPVTKFDRLLFLDYLYFAQTTVVITMVTVLINVELMKIKVRRPVNVQVIFR